VSGGKVVGKGKFRTSGRKKVKIRLNAAGKSAVADGTAKAKVIAQAKGIGKRRRRVTIKS
jgi:hypothetical protein